ncbi:hypothetical protein MKX01_018361, partial [Papaver californicum]
KGIGKDCSEWPPVFVTYMYEPEIHKKKDMMASLSLVEKQSRIESGLTKVLDINPKTPQNAKVIGKSGLVERTGKEDNFTFAVESINGKKVSQIVIDAI